MTSWVFSPSVLKVAGVPVRLRERFREATAWRSDENTSFPVVVGCASDILGRRQWRPPVEVAMSTTRYLILIDVPQPAIPRLVSAFDLRRPEQRLYVTPAAMAVQRLLLAQLRDRSMEGIVDGYFLGDELVLLLGDFSIRSFPVPQLPELHRMRGGEIERFELDEDGSFLYWPEHDLHLGVSQLLQAVDPSYLADIEIRRLPGSTAVGAAITRMREERGLRQNDIPGLSERQVRRIEKAISRLSSDAASRFALAFQMGFEHFLNQLARAAAAANREQPLEHDEADLRSFDSLISS